MKPKQDDDIKLVEVYRDGIHKITQWMSKEHRDLIRSIGYKIKS